MRSVTAVAIGLLSLAAILPARPKVDGLDSETKRLLLTSKTFEVLSLDPASYDNTNTDAFHGWPVLGRVLIREHGVRARLVAALDKGVAEHDDGIALCFSPRHGIRASSSQGTIDLVICFECLQIQRYRNNERDGGWLTTDSPQPTFDQMLRAAQVPLPPGPKQ